MQSRLDVPYWNQEQEEGFAWVSRLMGRFQYKTGWHFDLTRSHQDLGRVILRVSFMAEDSRRGPNRPPSYREITMTFDAGQPFEIQRDDLIPVEGIFYVPPTIVSGRQEFEFFHWLRRTLQHVESHELDEWFRVDGNLPYDPHASGKHWMPHPEGVDL